MAVEIVELTMLRHPMLLRRLRTVRAGVHHPVAPLHAVVATSPEPVPFERRRELRPRRVRRGSPWGRAHTCAWFHVTGPLPSGPREDLALILDTDGEALVLDGDGNRIGAVTSRLTPIERHGAYRAKTRLMLRDSMVRGSRIEVWLDAGFNGKLVPPFGVAMVRDLSLVRVDRDAEACYLDHLAASYAYVGAQGTLRARYRAALDRAWSAWQDGDLAASRGALAGVLDGEPDRSIALTAVGHGHLDMAWLWPLRETRRKARRTYTTQLDLLQRYPQATYGTSQPQQLAWMQDDDPLLFGQVIEAIRSGRMEAQGGFWVEPDTNLPCGESLIRQAVHGQRYWREHLGHSVETCWLPDAFGYSANLPQILKSAGMPYFATIKLAWNEHNGFPHRSFWWEGIDGSRVLVHMPPEGSYNSSASAPALAAARDQHPEKDRSPRALLVYGTGDGGAGPGETHLELLSRESAMEGFPSAGHGNARAFFEDLALDGGRLPVWQGELYLEKHQGTLTTQAATKAANRRIEHLLHDTEYLAALAWWQGRAWPGELLQRIWRDVLLFQFHDLLPGSSIRRAHAECETRYEQIEIELLAECDAALAALTTPSGGDSGDARPWMVNSQCTRRTGYLKHRDRWYGYDCGPFESAPLTRWDGEPQGLFHDEHRIAGDRLEVRFAGDGSISSLRDLISGREHSAGYLNRLMLYRDPFSGFDAWDIADEYWTRPATLLRPERVSTFTDGPRLIRRHSYRHGRTRIEQDVILSPGQRYLLFETRVDWHERHRMLRADFRPVAWSDRVSAEIQFGHYQRSTRDDTPEQRAQFEICAHRWIDLSTADFGFSLLNDSKYGHRVKDRTVSLNLLRSPIYPDPRADRGRHTFRYAVLPHEGTLPDAATMAAARDLNARPIIGDGPLPVPAPFRIEAGSVALETVTRAQDGEALLLRLYEAHGRPTTARLRFGFPVGPVREVNLLEDDLGPADPARMDFSPFQLRTIRVERP